MHSQLCRSYNLEEVSETNVQSIVVILASVKQIILENESPLWFHSLRFRNSIDDVQRMLSSFQISEAQKWTSATAEWQALNSIMSKL